MAYGRAVGVETHLATQIFYAPVILSWFWDHHCLLVHIEFLFSLAIEAESIFDINNLKHIW